MRSIFRLPLALFYALYEFVRSYDNEIGRNQDGLPMLAEWQGHDPYNGYRAQKPNSSDLSLSSALPEQQIPFGAFVFISGRMKGSVAMLSQDITHLSTMCDVDIVIFSEQLCEANMVIHRTGNQVVVSTDQASFPLEVNGHSTWSAQIFDQDEVKFLGAHMVYVQLGY